ncbi:hypothetical protein ACFU53_02300 [Streptomyces sp. NPDC057474]|uniref:hypothetical protein n=1 Tax=Streptomyces sp. NPDC057474 TaxID=3346144 RepID=UPI0036A5C79F
MTWTTERLRVEYRQYYLCEYGESFDPGEIARIFEGNSLVGAGRGYLVILSGTHTGYLRLNIELHDNEPHTDFAQWESAVEVSYHSAKGYLFLQVPGGETLREAGNLAHEGPGWYRIRVHTRGRDEGQNLSGVADYPDDPVEDHLISIWRARPKKETIHKIEDQFGRRYWDSTRKPAPPVRPE